MSHERTSPILNTSNFNNEKHCYQNETLCWKCANTFFTKCSWDTDRIPVEGWDAEPTIINGSYGLVNSFLIHECPLFEPDVPTYQGMTKTTTRHLATVMVTQCYHDITNTFNAIKRLQKLPADEDTSQTLKELTDRLKTNIAPFYDGTLSPWIELFDLTWYPVKFTKNIKKKCEELNIVFDVDKFIAQAKQV